VSVVSITRSRLAAMIDHTLLRPEARADDVHGLCGEARELGVWSVCVSPTFVALASELLSGSDVRVTAVVGFPSGAHDSAVKTAEALRAAAAGAAELDMVMNLGLAAAGDWDGVAAEIAAVRAAVPLVTLKVILETALWRADQICEACAAAERGQADFVKTSTGFHAAGGASEEAVRTMAAAVGGRLGVKASGGIADIAAALAMLDAGATRLGLSRSAAVLGGLEDGTILVR
jgi:deoxyribose-phosphate aldolase